MVSQQKSDETETVNAEIVPANELRQPGATARRSEFENRIVAQAEVLNADTVDTQERIIRQVLNAETPEAVLTPTDVLQAKDLLGEVVTVYDFDWNESKYDVGSPLYATMDVLREGETSTVPVNCGHKYMLAQLVRLRELNAFPHKVRIITRKTSSHGTPLLELASPDWQPKGQPPF